MDLYDSFATSSGTSTPVKETPSSSTTDDGAAAAAAASGSTGEGGEKTEAAVSSSSSSSQSTRSGPTLEQELEQMSTFVSGMGKNLGSYWGQFRRQSATALKQSQQYASAAAKDITPLVNKAKAELDRLGEQAKASAAAGQAAALSSASSGGVNPDAPSLGIPPGTASGEDAHEQQQPGSPSSSSETLTAPANLSASSSEQDPAAASSSTKSGGDGAGPAPSSPSSSSSPPPLNATAFFSRLQSQLSSHPNFQSFQHNFASIQHELKQKVDFSKIDLAEASKRYETAMNQGEKYFKVASRELSDLFGEAVKIVPPEDATASSLSASGGSAGGKQRGGAGGGIGSLAEQRRKDAEVAAAGRKESLLHRVRSDPAVLLVDPGQGPASTSTTTPTARKSMDGGVPGDAIDTVAAATTPTPTVDTREAFARFLAAIEDKGGLEGEAWKTRVQNELDNVPALQNTYNALVPNTIPAEAFWTRYFFRVQQIEEDEARRREILESAIRQEEEEDFSWDMEDDSASAVDADDDNARPSDPMDKGKSTASEEAVSTPKLGGKGSSTLASASSIAAGSDDIDDAWGDDGDEAASATAASGAASRVAASEMKKSETKSSTPRNSSEEGTTSSFDVVSATSADPGSPKEASALSAAKKTPPGPTTTTSKPATTEEEDDDSDWE